MEKGREMGSKRAAGKLDGQKGVSRLLKDKVNMIKTQY